MSPPSGWVQATAWIRPQMMKIQRMIATLQPACTTRQAVSLCLTTRCFAGTSGAWEALPAFISCHRQDSPGSKNLGGDTMYMACWKEIGKLHSLGHHGCPGDSILSFVVLQGMQRSYT